MLSPFGNASFAGVYRESAPEVKSDYLYPAPHSAAADHAVLPDAGQLQSELFHAARALNGAALLDAYQFYFVSLLHWDFGVSSINGQAISEQLREVFPATMELCLLAFALALFIGIPLGIIAGVLRGKWQDTAISTFALLGFSMPVFWLALLLMLFFSLHWAGCRFPAVSTCCIR